MATSTAKIILSSPVEKVWGVVTNLKEFKWRSDLDKIEVLNEHQFVEYTKDGFTTVFTITLTIPFERWEFDMENENMKGHWTGIFSRNGARTEIEFIEDVTVKKFLLKPFIKTFLKKQQALYISDLQKELRIAKE